MHRGCCKKNEMVICRKCTTQQLRFDGSGRPVKPHDAVTDLPFRKEEKLERNQIWKKIEKT